jgi:tetratricopeptide (TPR) repeat protein
LGPSINPPVAKRLFEAEGEGAAELDYRIGEYLWTLYEKGSLHCDFSLYEAFDSLSFAVPDAFLVNCLYSSAKNPIPAIEGIRSRFANPSVPEMVISLEAALELYRTGKLDEAFTVAKDALHSFQKTGILPGEYRTLLLMAMIAFARKKGDDAVVYLEYALENAETMHDPLSVLSTRYAMAIVHFITGNYHFSLCNLESVGKTVESSYAKDWEILILFMKGRLFFELGNYPDAEILFQTAASLASVHQIPESVSLCRVWYARSLAHQKRFASAEGILSDYAQSIPEAILYLLESSLLSGRRIESLELPRRLEMPRDRLSWGHEGYSWRSGYSVAEDRCYGASGGQNVPERMYEALKLVYDWRFGSENDDASTASALASLARKALEESDPYAASYCLFCYEMGQSGNLISGADSMVFLSLGFKYMQRRANEIDDNALREQFMRNPTHNGRLYREARVHMLI